MIATVEWSKLFELVWVSALAAAAVAVIFSLVILGAAKAETAHRKGSHASAIVYGLLGVVALAAFFGTVVYGVSVIITK
jgi:hypothetical protein